MSQRTIRTIAVLLAIISGLSAILGYEAQFEGSIFSRLLVSTIDVCF
jgi:hypothetical protein